MSVIFSQPISATRRLIDFVFGSIRHWIMGFMGMADRTAPFSVVSGRHLVNSHGRIFETHYPIHPVCTQTLPSDSMMTGDAYDRRVDTYIAREGHQPT